MNEPCRAVEVAFRTAVAEAPCEEIVSYPVSAVTELPAVDQRSLPSFFVVGPPRTGSSWLHEVLSSYTRLPSASKETRFFDTHFSRGLEWYIAHYGPPDGARRMGEVAPTYFASALARERIARTVPQAKVICIFRNPVDRIVSLYRVKRAYGWIPWTFEEAIERDPELTESSRYASTLKLWQRSFGADNVLAGIYDDLRRKPQAFVDCLVNFIGVPKFSLADWQYGLVHDSEKMTHPRSYVRTRAANMMANWLKARRMDRVVGAFKRSRFRDLVLGGGAPFPRPPEELLMHLQEKFQPEVEELEEMLHRDLSDWKLCKAA